MEALEIWVTWEILTLAGLNQQSDEVQSGTFARNMLLFTHFNVWLDIEEPVRIESYSITINTGIFVCLVFCSLFFSESLIHCCMYLLILPPKNVSFFFEASFFTIYFIVFMVSWIAIRTSENAASRCSKNFLHFPPRTPLALAFLHLLFPSWPNPFKWRHETLQAQILGVHFPMIKQW